MADLSQAARARRTGLRLEYATLVWNLLEIAFALGAGLAARSLALVAFGLDSTVEVFASAVVVWDLRRPPPYEDAAASPRVRRALRLIAASFLVVGVWLVGNAIVAFANQHRPSESPVGLAFMALTVVVMFSLARAKRHAGRQFGSRTLVANAGLTFLDGCVAAGVCLALVTDLAFGWWWADAGTALVVGLVAVNEARTGWREAAGT